MSQNCQPHKLRKLQKGRTLTSIEEAAGWSPSQLSAAMSRKSMPGADLAIGLARALDVDVEWLFDEKLSWPPTPKAAATLDFNIPEVQRLLIQALGIAMQRAGEALEKGKTA